MASIVVSRERNWCRQGNNIIINVCRLALGWIETKDEPRDQIRCRRDCQTAGAGETFFRGVDGEIAQREPRVQSTGTLIWLSFVL